MLWINRIIALSELDRGAEALPDIARVCAIPADASGRGTLTPHFETMAIAALRAGDLALGRELVQRALAVEREPIREEQLELAVASALLARAEGDLARRLIQDMNGAPGLRDARLVRRPASGGEKGLVEVAGSLMVTVLDAVGANAVVEAVRALRPKPGSRKVRVTLKDGEQTREFFLDGDGLSERQFVKSVDAALAVFARREG